MDDKQIIFIAIFIAVLSILLLYQFIEFTKPIQISLYSNNEIPKDSLIEFQGRIQSMNFNEKTTSIKVCDTNCLTVNANNNLNVLKILSEGDLIKVKGTTKTYYQGIIVYAQEINYLG
ncbi:MAG: hypothetical protein WC356_02580 [Candidatus Micrarchaeia archaeon]|jgi:formylmethanofuran dehydrogenase subunit C